LSEAEGSLSTYGVASLKRSFGFAQEDIGGEKLDARSFFGRGSVPGFEWWGKPNPTRSCSEIGDIQAVRM